MNEKQARITRIAFIFEAGFEYFIALFTMGTFLVYILDAIGISDAAKGIISAGATFACSAQLFALFLTGRQVKRLVTIGHTVNQLAFTLLYLLPIFDLSPSAKSAILIILFFIGHIISNAVNPAKIAWLMSSVSNRRRGSFTAVKEMISLAGGMIVSVTLGRIADTYCDSSGVPTDTYYIICGITIFIITLIHTATLLVSTEPPIENAVKLPVRKVVKRLVGNKDLIKVSLVGIIWNFASGFSGGFFASYSMKELGFSMTTLALITTLGSLSRIAVSPLMGRIADKRSFSYSMTICYAIMVLAYTLQSVASPGPLRWLYLVYICLHGCASAGINSGVINLIYDYVKPDERSVALGVKNALGGFVGFFAALIGGALLSAIQINGGIHIFGITVYAQQLLSLVTAIVVVILIVYMRLVVAPLKRVEDK